MLLAGPARRSPRELATTLRAHLPADAIPDLQSVEVAGPGFLNFFFRPGWLAGAVGEVLEAGPRYGRSDAGGGRRVLVEFVSANPTGPLNVVNCRAAAFGDSLVRCLRAAGYAAEAEYYVNDAGGQFRKLGLSMEARLRQTRGEDAAIPEGGYPGDYLLDLAQAYAAGHGHAILDGPPESARDVLARYAVDAILARQREVLERFGVRYDHFALESAVRAAGGPERVVEALAARGRTAERDGALWLLSASAGDNDDRVLRKKDGEFTYRVPDIAYHIQKFERGYDRLIDIYGQDHHGEVPAVRIALDWLGYPIERMEVLLTQIIRLVRDGGDPERISKRQGTFITMEEFLDDVGVDAARYFFVMRTIDTHMDFDMDLARKKSQDNPVYYVQYAHARICSILRQAPEGAARPGAWARLTHPAEEALCRALAMLPDEIVAAAEGRAPHRLTAYARLTAERFHSFYVQCRVLGEDAELSAARLALCLATRTVLAQVLELLGVNAPQSM
jgi:arginyl-tRNA synthetase